MHTRPPLKALLVNNGSDTWRDLVAAAISSGLQVTEAHARTISPKPPKGFDLMVLSGGYWYDDELEHLATYRHELDLIRHAEVPILGICLGMQLMQVAYSGEVPLLDAPRNGLQAITVMPAGQALLGLPAQISVLKNHTRGVMTVAMPFETLAVGEGNAEIIRHRQRPLLGVQFHPEIGQEPARSKLFLGLVEAVLSLPGPSNAAG